LAEGVRERGAEGSVWASAGENCIVRSFIICSSHKILFGDQIEGNEVEMGEACGMHGVGVGGEMRTRLCGETEGEGPGRRT
jgi:hypothetical protein